MINSKDSAQRLNNAFIDFVQIEKDKALSKNQDIKLQARTEEQLIKKRCLASTFLDKSFHYKQIFEVWYLLHSR